MPAGVILYTYSFQHKRPDEFSLYLSKFIKNATS